MSGTDILQLIQSGGALGVLALGLFLILRGKLHTAGEFDDMREDRNFYRDLTLRALSVGHKVADVAEKVLTVEERKP